LAENRFLAFSFMRGIRFQTGPDSHCSECLCIRRRSRHSLPDNECSLRPKAHSIAAWGGNAKPWHTPYQDVWQESNLQCWKDYLPVASATVLCKYNRHTLRKCLVHRGEVEPNTRIGYLQVQDTKRSPPYHGKKAANLIQFTAFFAFSAAL